MFKYFLTAAYNLRLRPVTRSIIVSRTQNSLNSKNSNINGSNIKSRSSHRQIDEDYVRGMKWLDIDQSKAKHFFEKACNNSKHTKNDIVAKASFQLAQIYLDEKNTKKAQLYLEKTLRHASSCSSDTAFLIADIYYSMAFIMLEKSKYLSAQTYFEGFVELNITSENTNTEKMARAQLELGKLLLNNQDQSAEKNLQEALNFFLKDGKGCVSLQAECYQLLGNHYLIKGDYDQGLQNNLKSLKLLNENKREIENLEEQKFQLAKNFANTGYNLVKTGSVQNEEKALLFLRYAHDLFSELNEEQKGENSWMLAKILVNALAVLSRRSDKQECNKIIEKIEAENFKSQNFESLEDYTEYIIGFVDALVGLKSFESGYKLLRRNTKHFETSLTNIKILSDYYSISCTLSYENGKYEEALLKQKQLSELFEKKASINYGLAEKLFGAMTISLKCQINIQTDYTQALHSWEQMIALVQNSLVMNSVRDIFLVFIEKGHFSLCEEFLLKVLELKSEKSFEDHKRVIYTYLSILHSRKNDFTKTLMYSTRAKKTTNFSRFFNYFSKSSETLLSKVVKNSTLINECYKTLKVLQTKRPLNENILETLSSLWSLCDQFIEKSDMQSSLILLEEINFILQNNLHSSFDFQGNIQLLKILIGIEMGELESAVSLLKEVTEGKEVSCSNDFAPLVYFLYGDVLKDLNASEEAMLMWMKAVDMHLRMRNNIKKSNGKITTKNGSLFENLMSGRTDFLPDLYRRTVEQHFR